MTEMTSTVPPVNWTPDVPPSTQIDYFAFQKEDKHYLPDGQTYVLISAMNEGEKTKFQKRTQRDIVLERRSGDARMKMDAASDRHELIRTCVKGWNLVRQGQLVPFTERTLKDFLELADPKIVEGIEVAIRKVNPWLLGDMSAEDIRKEIENLEEMLVVAEEREAGEASSGSK